MTRLLLLASLLGALGFASTAVAQIIGPCPQGYHAFTFIGPLGKPVTICVPNR